MLLIYRAVRAGGRRLLTQRIRWILTALACYGIFKF